MMALTLDMRAADLALSEAEFYRLCQANPDLRLELTAEGHLILMPPTGWETGNRNFDLAQQFGNWVKRDGSGLGFDSSTGFRLPNGAIRSPDVAWVLKSRIEALSPDPNKFLPLCPDFAVELQSASDTLSVLQAKMQMYLNNGLTLGWLISPQDKIVEIYRPEQPVETVPLSGTLSGEPELPGLQVNLDEIF
ncbi:Uma2 family endonuclease [Leptolyngbya sp. BC1307]|uniref:Uma2 family endonuclease n=1 Tax=Leptolyngbya sp. BC1307 TaxID=2029589 RepID=UPI000EFA6F8E|nr:Uma2 family endonuclease [Leptolyngbya sp. BC1307]